MKQRWRQYADKIDALPQRERAMVFFAVIAVVVFMANALFIDPLVTRKTTLATRMTQQQAELQHAGTVKNVTVGGFVLLMVIAGLLYRQNRLRKKSNELLEHLLSEKEWLLKEVHHRVKNNLHTVICLLGSPLAAGTTLIGAESALITGGGVFEYQVKTER